MSAVLANASNPRATLLLSVNTLYGTTAGGAMGFGTIFGLTVPGPPPLAITHSGANAILSWPSSAGGFNLQSATNLAGLNHGPGLEQQGNRLPHPHTPHDFAPHDFVSP